MPKNKLRTNEETLGYKPKIGSHNDVSDGPFKRPLFYVDTKPTAGAGGVLEQQPISRNAGGEVYPGSTAKPMVVEDYTATGTGGNGDEKKKEEGDDEKKTH